MNNIDFKNLAKQMMFDLNESEIESLKDDFIFLNQLLALLDEIDTEGLETMIYPFEQETSFLREDTGEKPQEIEDVMKNAQRVKDNMICLPKVIG